MPSGIDAAEDEIQERLRAPRSSPAVLALAPRSSRPPVHRVSSAQRVDADAQHLQHRAGDLGEVAVLVLLPVPVGRQFGQAAVAGLAFAQFGRAFPHRLLELLAVVLEPLVQQPHLQHVVDARPHFDQVERLADEILRAGLQRAQLVARLGGDHEHRQIAVRVVGLEAFHHLESVHAGHLQIEQDQVVVVLAVQRADLAADSVVDVDARVAGVAQHLLEQADVGLLIVDDQDAGA